MNMKKKSQMIKMLSFFFALAILVVNMGEVNVLAKSKKNVVVVYFSATGTTRGVAQKINKQKGGKLIRIQASKPYTNRDLNYSNSKSRVSKEHASASSPGKSSVRPKIKNLKTIKKTIAKADIVYIGYPIWWGEAPHILYTLIENVSLKNKTVVPFATSASSGIGRSGAHLKARAKISSKTNWFKGKNFYGVPSQKTINNWVKKHK